jgi:endonuclease/exonuclease/phosphatase (EEP) superfamily protein YafD
MMISGIIAAAITGALVIPHCLPADYSGEADFTIGHYNLWHHNPTPELAFQTIEESNHDVFVIQEMNSEWTDITDSLFAQSHPYTIEVPMEFCCYGMSLYSKFPIVSYKVLDLEETPVIIAQLLIQNRTVTIISLHTRPPAFPNETERRNKQLETVASIAAAETTDCIVLGDFNVVPWDDVLKEFLKSGNLEVVRDGFQATYPMDLGFPLIPIDHITFSGSLTPTSSETVRLTGSDHKGLVAGFAFAD